MIDLMQTHFGSPYDELVAKKTCTNCKHRKYLYCEDAYICRHFVDEDDEWVALPKVIEDCPGWEEKI